MLLFKTIFVTGRHSFLGTCDLEGAPRLPCDLLNCVDPHHSLQGPDLLVNNACSKETKDSQTPRPNQAHPTTLGLPNNPKSL